MSIKSFITKLFDPALSNSPVGKSEEVAGATGSSTTPNGSKEMDAMMRGFQDSSPILNGPEQLAKLAQPQSTGFQIAYTTSPDGTTKEVAFDPNIGGRRSRVTQQAATEPAQSAVPASVPREESPQLQQLRKALENQQQLTAEREQALTLNKMRLATDPWLSLPLGASITAAEEDIGRANTYIATLKNQIQQLETLEASGAAPTGATPSVGAVSSPAAGVSNTSSLALQYAEAEKELTELINESQKLRQAGNALATADQSVKRNNQSLQMALRPRIDAAQARLEALKQELTQALNGN